MSSPSPTHSHSQSQSLDKNRKRFNNCEVLILVLTNVILSLSICLFVSGHGTDNIKILTEENKNPSGEDDLPLATQESAGECVLGIGEIATSIHSIKVELNKMNAEKITMTLDCCRNVSRDAEAFVVYLK